MISMNYFNKLWTFFYYKFEKNSKKTEKKKKKFFFLFPLALPPSVQGLSSFIPSIFFNFIYSLFIIFFLIILLVSLFDLNLYLYWYFLFFCLCFFSSLWWIKSSLMKNVDVLNCLNSLMFKSMPAFLLRPLNPHFINLSSLISISFWFLFHKFKLFFFFFFFWNRCNNPLVKIFWECFSIQCSEL